jgi:hypothetical protein
MGLKWIFKEGTNLIEMLNHAELLSFGLVCQF